MIINKKIEKFHILKLNNESVADVTAVGGGAIFAADLRIA